MKMIRIASHRAWSRVERAIGRYPQGFFNSKYSGHYGLSEVTSEEWESLGEKFVQLAQEALK